MRIGVVYIGDNRALEGYKNDFVQEVAAKGHQVTEFDLKGEGRIGGMQYLVFFVDSGNLFGKKYTEEISKFFQDKGGFSAHYASIYIQNRPFVNKTFLRYMRKIEETGLIVHNSDLIMNKNHAREIAARFTPIKPGG